MRSLKSAQPGTSMPGWRHIWASTSLISLSDLRPKFGRCAASRLNEIADIDDVVVLETRWPPELKSRAKNLPLLLLRFVAIVPLRGTPFVSGLWHWPICRYAAFCRLEKPPSARLGFASGHKRKQQTIGPIKANLNYLILNHVKTTESLAKRSRCPRGFFLFPYRR